MNIVRKLAISLMAGIMGTLLFGLAWANIGLATVHDRKTVNSWFTRSNFYGQIVDVMLEKAKNSKELKESDIPVNDPALQAVAKQAFNPLLLQTSVEQVLNGTYSYLDGSAKDLSFSIDLTAAKQQFATGMGNYVANRVATLPVCPANQPVADYDGFSATCRPKSLTPAQAGAKATNDFLNKDFLKDPIITSDKLKQKQDDGTETPISSDKKATALRSVYQRSANLPLVLAVVIVLLAAAIVLISSNRRRGIRRVGYVFFSSGALLLVIYILLNVGLTKATSQIATSNAAAPQLSKLLTDMARVIVQDIKGVLVWYVGFYIGIGILAFIVAGLLKKHSKETSAKGRDTDKETLDKPGEGHKEEASEQVSEQPKDEEHKTD